VEGPTPALLSDLAKWCDNKPIKWWTRKESNLQPVD
jgi:hypothetical protein